MPTARLKLRKQINRVRTRKPRKRKLVQELDDDIAPIAVGSPQKGE